jgi:hypothetical protein
VDDLRELQKTAPPERNTGDPPERAAADTATEDER